ncbi:MAG: nucleoside hydrolase [Ignavibacteriales bacterium]|nr:nucleoside hydrolase [Ignavibacteriales bacterium]
MQVTFRWRRDARCRSCNRPCWRRRRTGIQAWATRKLPEPLIQPIGQHGSDFLIEKILSNPGEITLVAVGPLTNVALAIRKEPRVAKCTQRADHHGRRDPPRGQSDRARRVQHLR